MRRQGTVDADDALERGCRGRGFGRVAGVDEVGRGPLAGPVVAAAVVLDPAGAPAGLRDSKLLSEAERERLFDAILDAADLAVAAVPAGIVDCINIRQASLLAMRRALLGLATRPDVALIDGRDVPPGLPFPAEAHIGGDRRSVSIAAASIVAKVLRDRMMRRAEADLPGYGFGRHKGYPTTEHAGAILALGPSALHRMTFGRLAGGGKPPSETR